ncbi:MAG: DivIVA domain-containing protein [Acidimicrobiia bacterium]|nr:DivIVA domain-containing protein [Acidimicrobiia bacterium]
MELIKKVETTEFSQRLRGYDIEEVDAFHAELIADIKALQRALEDARSRTDGPDDRPERSESRSRPETPARLHDPEGAIQRMLAVAQRTADEAVRDAKLEAAKAIADAEDRADKTVSESEEHKRLIMVEAAAEARRVAEETRAPLLEDVAELESQRELLVADVKALEDHIASERARVTESVGILQQLLDDPDSLRVVEAPELRSGTDLEVEADDFADDDGPDHDDDEAELGWEPNRDEPVIGDPDIDIGVTARGDNRGDDEPVATESDLSSSIFGAGRSGGDHDDPRASITDLASARNEVLDRATEPLPEPEPVDMPPSLSVAHDADVFDEPASDPPDASGPPTQAVLIDDLLGEDPNGNDRFLDELRRATEDEFDTDESDAAIQAFFDQDDPNAERGPKFGRRS